MKHQEGLADANLRTAIWILWGLSVLPLGVLCFGWTLSPLGIGFATFPAGIVGGYLKISYLLRLFVAMPLLFSAMVACPILLLLRRTKLAMRAPLVAFAFFAATAGPPLILAE